jgi:hypothetical protein
MAQNKPSPSTTAIDFHLVDDHGYPLEYSHRASVRLNLQHLLWRETFGFSIHPSIQVTATSGDGEKNDTALNIADVACGTGLWLMDVARELPRAWTDWIST